MLLTTNKAGRSLKTCLHVPTIIPALLLTAIHTLCLYLFQWFLAFPSIQLCAFLGIFYTCTGLISGGATLFCKHSLRIENFRMSQTTFNYLRQNTRMRKAIPVQRPVAFTIWCLATSVEYRTIGHLFGVARCTVCRIVQNTCAAIVKVLLKQYISFPTGDRLNTVVEGFEQTWGLPQCAGSIDGSHIPIAATTANHTDYYNRKGWYSVVVQAVVDYQY